MERPRQQSVAVVDADPVRRAELVVVLDKAGYSVLPYADTEQILAAASGQAPGLLIAALSLPDLEGWRLCRLLRSSRHPDWNRVPILLVSDVLAGEEARRITAHLGGKGLVPFPIAEQRLLDLVAESLAAEDGTPPALAGRQRRPMERRFRKAVQDAGAGYFFIDAGGCFRWVNRAWLRMHAYSDAAEVIGRHFSLTQVENDLEKAGEVVRQLLAGVPVPAGEFTRKRKDGSIGYHIFSAHPVLQGGRVVGLEGFLIDSTALHQLEERYEMLFNSMLDGFALHEMIFSPGGEPADYRFLAVNPAFERITGLSAQAIVGRTVLEVLPGTEPVWIEKYGQVALTGEPCRFESSHTGLGRHFEVVAFRPQPGQFACIFRDITERRQAEQALRDSESLLRESQAIAGVGSYVLDIASGLWKSSVVLDEIFGIDDQYERSVEGWAALLDPECRQEMVDYFTNKVLGQRRRFDKEYRIIRHNDGAGRWVHGVGELELDGQGRPVRMIGAIRDITAGREANERLLQALKMESVGRLAGGVAHDFNNLLTVINGYSQLLLAGLGPADPLRPKLEEIQKAGERAAGLTRQLLAFSRKQVLQPRVFDLEHVIGDLQPMLARLVGEDVEVRVVLRAAGAMVRADPHQLEQAVMNLVVNARDALPAGGRLLIETACVERGQDSPHLPPDARAGRFVLLAVSDNGVGMDEATRRRIFEPFFTTKEAGKGTGLGLPMVQGIVAQSGGFIEVYSEPGRGTTFKIYLPRVDGAAAEDRPETAEALTGHETVLVVEDQPEVREFAAAALESYGYRIIKALGADEALSICQRPGLRIDLVLTDVVMPKVSGRQLAARLERVQPGIKVLYMSGYTDDAIVHHGILDERADFIQKPFSPEQLALRVRQVLGPPKCRTRILVVDDEADVRGFLRAVLEQGGYEVMEAADGIQALAGARAGRVDLVLTDLVMPEKEGIETIQALRKELPGIRIIAISGAFDDSYLKIAQMVGADAVLGKPVSAAHLLAAVEETLASPR